MRSPFGATDLQVAHLLGEVQELTAVVRKLVATTPHRSKTWLEPREMAQLLGVSNRTLSNWRSLGHFRPTSFRQTTKGFQYHATEALADAQREQS
jgi:DNA-binding transcriptional regulator YiaG